MDTACTCPNVECRELQLPYLTELAVEAGNLPAVKGFVQSQENAINATNSKGETILHLAAKYSKPKVAKYLLKWPESRVMHLNCRRECGRTPLMVAAENGCEVMVGILICKTSKLQCKLNLTAATPSGKTAVSLANRNSHYDISDMISLAQEGKLPVDKLRY